MSAMTTSPARVSAGGSTRQSFGAASVTVSAASMDGPIGSGESAESPDGRFGLVAIGMSRVSVQEWLPDDPYPMALVSDLPDTPPTPEELSGWVPAYAEVVALTRRTVGLAIELGVLDSTVEVDPVDDPARGSFALAAAAPLGPFDRYRILAATSVLERLRLLHEALLDLEEVLHFRLAAGGDDAGTDT